MRSEVKYRVLLSFVNFLKTAGCTAELAEMANDVNDSWWFKSIIFILIAIFYIVCNLSAPYTVKETPFCHPTNLKDGPILDLMIVSTLDGKLTAFSTQNGIKLWDVETQPLLSNLHNIDLKFCGKSVRLVPSLRGTLFSVSGETIEPLPFDADQLLSSSYKYSDDDLVIAGAKETISYGVDASTGGVLYECGSRGCNSEQSASKAKDILVLSRRCNTLRASDPRVGTEKWNFSVAEHQLALSRGEVVGGATPSPSLPYQVAVALHNGRLALKTPGSSQPIWQQQLEAPLAGMWRLSNGELKNIDMLSEAWQTLAPRVLNQEPSLYIGVHEQQLYVQERRYSPKLETAVGSPSPWKLISAQPRLHSEIALQVPGPDVDKSLTKVMLCGPTGNIDEYGFFIYHQETDDQSEVSEDENPDDSEDSTKRTPLMMNQESIAERHSECLPPLDYVSRYESEYTQLDCLGEGGFGIVFEARNNIDNCSYAVKRIKLPEKENERERELREVRALAKLKHPHIVGYHSTWVERPPSLLQQQRDDLGTRSQRSHESFEIVFESDTSKEVKSSEEFSTSNTSSKKGNTRFSTLNSVVENSSTQSDAASVLMYLYIQMELCHRDSLHDWLRNNRTNDARSAMIKPIFSEIVSAVEYLHLAGYMHRDLKPTNILFALDGRVKVGDLGLVTAMKDSSSDGDWPEEVDAYHRHTHHVGTPSYMSPEQLQGLPYSYKVDIYSLGLILFELLQPFGTEAERADSLNDIRDDIYPTHFHQEYPNETEVLKLMLSEEPSHRPTASGVRARAPLYELTDKIYHFTLPAMAAVLRLCPIKRSG